MAARNINMIESTPKPGYNPLIDSLSQIEDVAKKIDNTLQEFNNKQSTNDPNILILMQAVLDISKQQEETNELLCKLIENMTKPEPEKTLGILDRAKSVA